MTASLPASRLRALSLSAALVLSLGLAPAVRSQDASSNPPPKSWIDPDTGHRVIRLTDEPGSDSFYFNFNAYTPDGKEMIYTTSDGGISVLNLETLATVRWPRGSPGRSSSATGRRRSTSRSRPRIPTT